MRSSACFLGQGALEHHRSRQWLSVQQACARHMWLSLQWKLSSFCAVYFLISCLVLLFANACLEISKSIEAFFVLKRSKCKGWDHVSRRLQRKPESWSTISLNVRSRGQRIQHTRHACCDMWGSAVIPRGSSYLIAFGESGPNIHNRYNSLSALSLKSLILRYLDPERI